MGKHYRPRCRKVDEFNIIDAEKICKDKLYADKARIKHELYSNEITANKIIAGQNLLPEVGLSYPIPDGPFSVDHFQIGKDNVQLRSPEKWRVDQFTNKNLMVDGVKTMMVDGVEYFGYMDGDYPVYLTYPLPLVLDVFVPSTRKNCHKGFNFFADDSSTYIGDLSLAANVYIQGTHFWQLGGPEGAPGLVEADYVNQNGPSSWFSRFLTNVPDENSLANKVLNTPLSEWTGLQGIYLLDDLSVDAYNRLIQVKADLAIDLVANAMGAYLLMSKIMGSYGVPTTTGGSNCVLAADRTRAFNLIMSSSNVQLIKQYQCFSKRHSATSVKQNDIYNPNYNFSNIDTKYGKVPLIILAEPNSIYYGSELAEKWASWGLATCMYNVAYNTGSYNHVPGKLRSVNEILNSGTCFPDVTNLQGYVFTSNNANYSVQAESSTNLIQGYIQSMGYQYDATSSHTGTTSFEFNRDIIFNVIDSLKNSTDINGNQLSDYMRFTQMGVFGRSGGSMALNGAYAIQAEMPGSFTCGIGHDIVLSTVYLETGQQTGIGDFTGGFSEELTFPGGLNYPVMFLEPETDWYTAQSDKIERNVVGSRKTLQNIIRKTPLTIRSRSIYLELSLQGHINQTQQGYMNDGYGYQLVTLDPYPQPDIPQLPNVQYDPIWGFKDTTHLPGNINASTALAMAIYFRSMLSTWETIRFNAFNYLPFKFDVSPWDIPDADDYQWRKREYSQDLGGKFNIRLDLDRSDVYLFSDQTGDQVSNPFSDIINPGDALYFYFDLSDPSTEAIEVNLSWTGLPLVNLTPDLDIELYSPIGNIVQASYYQHPELIRYDLTTTKPEDRLGRWYIGVFFFDGGAATYTLGVQTGDYKVIIDREYDNPQPPGPVPPHPELAVTKRGISMINLPTSNVGLRSGDLYSDTGVIKIVP